LLKALLLAIHLGYGIALALYVACGGDRRTRRERLTQAWSWRLLEILGIRVQMEGAPLRGAHLTASNHVSWLDIPVLAALEPTRFISKAEVRHWPIAGWFAVAAGTFFIRRGKGGAAPLLEKLVPHLRSAGAVVLFPEGTTTDGTQVRPFHARLFQAAVDAGCPVQPVTVQYGLAPDGRNVAPFIGDDSLLEHVLRLLRTESLEVRVCYGPPIRPHRGRDELAQEAEAFVRGALQPLSSYRRFPVRLSPLRI
jgi:1-acyl-sn-glycerol-3-phosphate acyltransferase